MIVFLKNLFLGFSNFKKKLTDKRKNNKAKLSVVNHTAEDLKYGDKKINNDNKNKYSLFALENFFFNTLYKINGTKDEITKYKYLTKLSPKILDKLPIKI